MRRVRVRGKVLTKSRWKTEGAYDHGRSCKVMWLTGLNKV